MPDEPGPIRNAVNTVDTAYADFLGSINFPRMSYFTLLNAGLGNREARARLRTEVPKAARFGLNIAAGALLGRASGATSALLRETKGFGLIDSPLLPGIPPR